MDTTARPLLPPSLLTHLSGLVELPEVNSIIIRGLVEGYHVFKAMAPQDVRGLVGEACLHSVAR